MTTFGFCLILIPKLIQSYELTHWVIHRQADGLTHADSMLQLPFRGNCFNWVLGHILVSRDMALGLLGETAVLNKTQTAVYATDSEPLTEGRTAVLLPNLLAMLDDTQKRLTDALNAAPPETLEKWLNEERRQTIADRLAELHWHETYHTGQLEILRQLAGKDDKIV